MADRGTAQRLDVAVQQPGRWVCHAACRDHMELFIQPTIRRGRPRREEVVDGKRVVKSYEDKIAEVKAICRGCPVLEQCRAWALTAPDPAEAMIAGGLTFAERVVLRRAFSPRAPVLPAELTLTVAASPRPRRRRCRASRRARRPTRTERTLVLDSARARHLVVVSGTTRNARPSLRTPVASSGRLRLESR